jgi:hypothetical protein
MLNQMRLFQQCMQQGGFWQLQNTPITQHIETKDGAVS